MNKNAPPIYMPRPRRNDLGTKQRIAVAQSCADRFRKDVKVSLDTPPWEKTDGQKRSSRRA